MIPNGSVSTTAKVLPSLFVYIDPNTFFLLMGETKFLHVCISDSAVKV